MHNLTPSQSNLTHDDAETAPVPDPAAPGGEPGLDRRGILRFGGVAALAGTAAAVLGASAAGASITPAPIRFGANNDSGSLNTGLTSTNGKFTLHVKNAGLGHAIFGDATNDNGHGFGVHGVGIHGAGVVGGTSGRGPGVRAYVEPGAPGSALQAVTLEPNNAAPTVTALQGGLGHGLYSHIENENNASRAVYGRTAGTGHAVLASVVNARSETAALKATTQGSGAGLEAVSAAGVGATFAGKTAQVQLVPSGLDRPASGAAGQLVVDRANRLWFCRGGSDWQQLA